MVVDDVIDSTRVARGQLQRHCLKFMGQIYSRDRMSTPIQCQHDACLCSVLHVFGKPRTYAVPQFVAVGLWEVADHAIAFVGRLNSGNGRIRPALASASYGEIPFEAPPSTNCTRRHFDSLPFARDFRGFTTLDVSGGVSGTVPGITCSGLVLEAS